MSIQLCENDNIGKIANLGYYIKNIKFHHTYRDDDCQPQYKITVYTTELPPVHTETQTGDKIRYEFCMDSQGNASHTEAFGWYYCPNTPPIDNTIYARDNLEKIPEEVKKYFGKKIKNIKTYEFIQSNNDGKGCSIVMEINLEDDDKFNFVMYNNNTGKNPLDLSLDIYKNTDPMSLYCTRL